MGNTTDLERRGFWLKLLANNIELMNMKKFFVIALLLPLLFSCEGTTENVEKARGYFPLKVGNYWIFNYNELNENNISIPEKSRIDSFAISGSSFVFGKSAYLMVHFVHSAPADTLYFATDNDVLYQLFTQDYFDLPAFDTQWLAIADLKNSSWHLFDTTLKDYPQSFDNGTVYSTAQFTLNAKLNWLDTFGIDNNRLKFLAMGYQIKSDRMIFFDYKFPADLDFVKVETTRLQLFETYLADGVGFLRFKKVPYLQRTKTVPTTNSYSGKNEAFGGEIYELIRYNVK